MSKYRKTIREALEEIYVNEAQSHTVRYTDPLNKKRFAVPFKTHDAAEKKMAQLKKDGVKDIKITMDTLKPGVSFKEDNDNEDHEISMARGELEAIADKATQLASMLQGKSDEGNPLEAWVQSKITKAKDYINSVSDYLMYNPDMKQNEEVELDEAMSDAQLKKIRDQYKEIKTISPEKVKTLKNFLDRYSTDSLMQLAQANINFVSTMARSVMNKRKMGDPKHAGSSKTGSIGEKTDMQRVADLRTRQMMLQMKLRELDPGDPKDKTKREITKNDIENIQMKMDQIRKDTKEEIDDPRPGPANPNPNSINEKIEGIENKSEKSGIPYGILKQVYDRGMAAWKGGHRPGTTPQQWAFARINSFITKGKTYYTADADLAKKARKSKKK